MRSRVASSRAVGLGEAYPAGGEQDDGLAGEITSGFWSHAERFDALKEGFRLEDHAFATAERAVVNGSVAIVGELAKVVGSDGELNRRGGRG